MVLHISATGLELHVPQTPRSNSLESQRHEVSWKHLTSYGNLSFLNSLDLLDNSFRGEIPQEIHGNITKEIANLVNLNILYLQENRLTGSIPASIGILSNLGTVDLDSNRLTGEIPSSIGNIMRLIYCYFSGNTLNGTIPPSLGNCKQLLRLYIGENNLSGTIPARLVCHLLAHVNISYNSFMGSLPMEIGD
ncbi:hypothetical protein RND71_029428 [Anisodus tanguticus]|uniref:Uncharacterized protein n=1 Tax=Anisodus tanguticus TaxID=243964 RepID=A0AAE1REG3_9SOLA|nr:hypothetical protein RND71_029428 [Anisodus tanguticus]